MLYGLEPGLQRRFERHGAYEMFQELKLIFQANARIEKYEISNKFYSCKMEENSSISEHLLRMSGYYNHMTQLGCKVDEDSVIDRVLQSLPPSYKGFVMNYNMQGMQKTIPELFAMLKAAEVEIKKEHQVLMVNKTTTFKKKGKGKKGNFKKNSKLVAHYCRFLLTRHYDQRPFDKTVCFAIIANHGVKNRKKGAKLLRWRMHQTRFRF